jgi:curved DNA-binding protein CbpA
MNHYETLGVMRDASTEEIEQRYRMLREGAGQDAAGVSDQTIKSVDEAYAVLSDPARREAYDRTPLPDRTAGTAPRRRIRLLPFERKMISILAIVTVLLFGGSSGRTLVIAVLVYVAIIAGLALLEGVEHDAAGAPDQTKTSVGEAYAVLSDPARREASDRTLLPDRTAGMTPRRWIRLLSFARETIPTILMVIVLLAAFFPSGRMLVITGLIIVVALIAELAFRLADGGKTPRKRLRIGLRVSERSRKQQFIIVSIALIVQALILLLFHSLEMRQEGLAREATRSYAQAIVSFEQDHGGRPPLMDTADWPNRLAGPVDAWGRPYMSDIPKYVRSHSFRAMQTELRSEGFTGKAYVLQYIPYGETFSVKEGRYIYEGYLLLIESPPDNSWRRTWWTDDDRTSCEAWGNPVQVACGDDRWKGL